MQNRPTLAGEFYAFIMERKAYWMIPIVLTILLLATLAIVAALGGGAAAPFVYTLF